MNYQQQENRLSIFKRDKFRCIVCGNPITRFGTPQLAHRIKQSKYNLRKYGERIIHHPLNTGSTCQLSCNAKLDLGVKDELINDLLKKIIADLEKKLKSEEKNAK